jgi:uncharacterized protein YecE (DUF72 family)
MKFGSVINPEEIDFSLQQDHTNTLNVLGGKPALELDVFVGCAKWNRTDLKGFYPRGTKDELGYYSSQFNCIELNATFYRLFPRVQFETWKSKTPDNFKFFTKLGQEISHWKRLKGTDKQVDAYIHAIEGLEHKFGGAFLQMHNNFAPKSFDDLSRFLHYWPKAFPLSVELRHQAWYSDPIVNNELLDLLNKTGIGHVLTDTAGRRDMVHMALSNKRAFIRYTGANHTTDYSRLDDWVERIAQWKELGLEELDFFVHQNLEKESPTLSAHFIEKLNNKLGLRLKAPTLDSAGRLF